TKLVDQPVLQLVVIEEEVQAGRASRNAADDVASLADLVDARAEEQAGEARLATRRGDRAGDRHLALADAQRGGAYQSTREAGRAQRADEAADRHAVIAGVGAPVEVGILQVTAFHGFATGPCGCDGRDADELTVPVVRAAAAHGAGNDRAGADPGAIAEARLGGEAVHRATGHFDRVVAEIGVTDNRDRIVQG